MKYLYLISQDINTGYDKYDSAVVCAESEDAARAIDPSGSGEPVTNKYIVYGSWAELDKVKVERIGEAAEGIETGVICASFNAG